MLSGWWQFAAPIHAQTFDPWTVPFNPATWITVQTTRTEDGKASVVKTRYWLSGSRVHYESFDGDWNGKKIASAYYDYANRILWMQDASGAFTKSFLDLSEHDEGKGWERDGSETLGGHRCSVWVQKRGGATTDDEGGPKKGTEVREWRAGKFVLKRTMTSDRSFVRMLGMVLPVPAQTQTLEIAELKKAAVTDADVTPPANAKP